MPRRPDIENVYELLKEKDMSNGEALKKKPWWKSRKLLTAVIGGILELVVVIFLQSRGIEVPPALIVSMAGLLATVILGIAHEDSKIIPAKVMGQAAKEIEDLKSIADGHSPK